MATAQTTKQAIRKHYFRLMPDQKHHRVAIWVVFFVVVAIMIAQLLYPANRALPFARLHGVSVAFHKDADIAYKVNELFQSMELDITVDDASVKETLGALGGEVDTLGAIVRLTDYPFWQRFVPLSILFHHPDVRVVEIGYNEAVLRDFSTGAAAALSKPPTNAQLSLENGVLSAVNDETGRTVTPDDVRQAVLSYSAVLGENGSVETTSTTIQPDTTDKDLASVRQEAEAALARSVSITADGRVFTPDASEVASWLEISTGENDEIVLSFSASALHEYLEEINVQVGTPAGETVVRLTDGTEVSREMGSEGRMIDYDTLTGEISSWVLRGEGSGEFSAQFVTLTPAMNVAGNYTSSQAGLRAYVNDAARAQNATIVVQQLDGNKWSADAGGATSMPSASTYKLYVAWMLFNKMDQGDIGWDDPMLGTTVSNCFDQMTIASTNACAEQWLDTFGRTNINNFLYSRGYSAGTTFTNPTAAHTTANDLAKFMVALENGSAIGGAHRDRLLHSLSVHPYRRGVPSGSDGQVWDKVGFLWDYVHDAAIVHHPKGKYVIVVMTKGRSYATIAEITRQVEKIMYP